MNIRIDFTERALSIPALRNGPDFVQSTFYELLRDCFSHASRSFATSCDPAVSCSLLRSMRLLRVNRHRLLAALQGGI